MGNALNLSFLSERFKLSLLETYLGTIFSNMQGNAVSDLKVTAGKSNKTITGSVAITDGSFKVNYTQCTYKFTNETILFNPDEIDLGEMVLTDTLGNNANASGRMYHKFFQDFEFDNVKLDTRKMLLLNTSKKDNSQFYGKIIGNAKLKIDGPITDMKMDIEGEASNNELDSNHIYIPSSTGKEAGAIDYIEFIQFGTKMEDLGKSNQGTNIVVNMSLTANPACKIDVILDEETGDIIKGRGNGVLKIKAGNKENLDIRGTYNITGGEYTFNFQTILKKYFTISGGTINWSGDPYKAAIDIKAKYLAEKVDVSSIPSSTSKGFKQKENVTIVSHLTGELQKPIIDFEFEVEGDIKNDFVAKKYLADLKSNQNEMNKQVASILLFGSFISNNQNFLSGGNVAGIATNTIGGMLSSWLTNLFNRELERATKGILSTYVDLSTTIDLQQQAKQLQANIRAGLKILLSNRVQILVGGNLDYNNPYAQLQKRGLLTPDLSIEWLVNKEGSIRVVGFNRTSTDLNLGQRNRTGISLTYRKDFDKISDIFRRKKKKTNP
ncbi:MAG: translocation/assembly module TamB domain-containing protein [Chitinophagaceae bacterium]|nr:translocation/assembly module TamB domain-containing protein [Chitinophagaceae bacterium]